MPRNERRIEAGLVYHVLNRGNGRLHLFHKDEDFEVFERVLAEGLERYPVDLLTGVPNSVQFANAYPMRGVATTVTLDPLL